MKHPQTPFVYNGYHFIPQEHLSDMSFEDMTKQLKSDFKLGFSDYKWGKHPYSPEDFYKAHGYKVDGKYYFDTFLCKETGKIYIPGDHELFEWTDGSSDPREKSLRISMCYQVSGYVSVPVPADMTLEEAIKYAKENIDGIPLPDHPEYICDSEELDENGAFFI